MMGPMSPRCHEALVAVAIDQLMLMKVIKSYLDTIGLDGNEAEALLAMAGMDKEWD